MKKQSKKAIIYCRVSSERQRREGGGLESQEQRCRQHCISKEYGEPVMVFTDSFTGGGDFMRRPGMSALMVYLDSNPLDDHVVVFDDISRLARDVVSHVALRTAFDKRGVEIDCPNFNFGDSAESELVEIIMAAQSQYHRKSNTRQVIQKQKARLELGCWSFHAPKGYQMEKTEHGKIAFPNDISRYLKEGLEGFASKRFTKLIELARFWRQKGVFPKRRPAEKYLDTTKKYVLNSFYAGFIEYPKWEVSRRIGKHEAIISPGILKLNENRIKKEERGYKIREELNPSFPLRGLVCCSSCGSKLRGYKSKSKTGKLHAYYDCGNRKCELKFKTIKGDLIHDGYRDLVTHYKPREGLLEVIEGLFDEVWNDEMKDVDKLNKKLLLEKEKIEGEIRSYTDEAMRSSNQVVKDQYHKRIAEKAEELNSIEGDIERKPNYDIPYRTSLNQIRGMIESPYQIWLNADVKQKHELFSFMFNGFLEYEHGVGYRTPEKTCLIRLFNQFESGHSLDVEMGGLEPPCKKEAFKRLHI
jgi:site-specific DNA recombinase